MDYYTGLAFRLHSAGAVHQLRGMTVAALGVRVLLVGIVLIVSPRGFPATLSIANQTVSPGQTVAVPLLLSAGGEAISGIQFDLQWDQTLAVQIASGIAMGQSYKVLYQAEHVPSTLRCLIVGTNLNSLADGAVIELFISAGNVPAGVAKLALSNVLATNARGTAVAIQPVSASIQIQNGTTQVLSGATMLSGASLLSGAVAPGEIVTLLGSYSPVPQAVLFNGVTASIISVAAGRVNAIVPSGLSVNGPAQIQIRSQNQTLATGSVPVLPVSPAIFTETGTGTGQCLALNQDSSVNSFSDPAAAGSILMIYGTGFGLLRSALTAGQTASGPASLDMQVSATIGGIPAQVLYAGAAPSLVAAVTQINVRVPQGLPANTATPIVLNAGSVATPPGVTVAIR
jgi:uncharacterized protein (TIGR03437 family)